MKILKFIPAIVLVFTVFACSQPKKEKDYRSEEKATVENEDRSPDVANIDKAEFKSDVRTWANTQTVTANDANGYISSSAAVVNKNDPSRKFIRTADIKFRSKDVINTTYSIEDIAGKNRGFVAHTNLKSQVDNKTTVQVSKDSSMETTYYTVTNSMTLRIPDVMLDTTLKSLSSLVDYMDYRVIKADDVSLSLLANEMKQRRISDNEKRMQNAIDERGRKLRETTEAEENIYSRGEEKEQAKLANLALIDQVKYSTVNLTIYQKQTLQREIIRIPDAPVAYEPSFGDQISAGFSTGWNVLQSILVFLSKIWSLLLLIAIGYLIFRLIRTVPVKGLQR